MAGEGLSEPRRPLVCEVQTGRSPAPLNFLWPRAGRTGAPQDAPLYFSAPLGQGGSPSSGGAPEPRIASRRVPGGVARAAQDSRLPPPAVGAALLPPRPVTALGPAGQEWAQQPSGHSMSTRLSFSTQGPSLSVLPHGQESCPSLGPVRMGQGCSHTLPTQGGPPHTVALPWGSSSRGLEQRTPGSCLGSSHTGALARWRSFCGEKMAKNCA